MTGSLTTGRQLDEISCWMNNFYLAWSYLSRHRSLLHCQFNKQFSIWWLVDLLMDNVSSYGRPLHWHVTPSFSDMISNRHDQYVPIQDRPLLVGSDIREPRSGPAFKESNQFEHNFYRKRLYQQPWWCFCFFDNSIFMLVTELWKLLSIFYYHHSSNALLSRPNQVCSTELKSPWRSKVQIYESVE